MICSIFKNGPINKEKKMNELQDGTVNEEKAMLTELKSLWGEFGAYLNDFHILKLNLILCDSC